MKVAIQVENGRVIISLGGQSSAKAPGDQVTASGDVAATGRVLGGDAATESEATGSGGPQGGALVIGPIVIPGTLRAGGSTTGGDAATESEATGSGGPGGGVLVIGPIVLGGVHSGAANSASTAVAVNPPA